MPERYECYAILKSITVTRFDDPRLLLKVRQKVSECEQDGGCPEDKCQIRRLEKEIYSRGERGEIGYFRCSFCEKLVGGEPSPEEEVQLDEWTGMPVTVYERTCSMEDKITGSFLICEVPDEFTPLIELISE